MDLKAVGWRCYLMPLRRETAAVVLLRRRDWVCRLQPRRMLRAGQNLSRIVVQLVRTHLAVMTLLQMDWDCLLHSLDQKQAWKLVQTLAEMPVQTLTVRKQALLPSGRAGRNRYSGQEQKAGRMPTQHHQEQKVVRMLRHQYREQKADRTPMHHRQEQKAVQMPRHHHQPRMAGRIQSSVLGSRVAQTLNLRHQQQKPDRNQVVRAFRKQRPGRTWMFEPRAGRRRACQRQSLAVPYRRADRNQL
jgi:hypothetical protein